MASPIQDRMLKANFDVDLHYYSTDKKKVQYKKLNQKW